MKMQSNRQAGGTLLGIIIGLVMGLAIALVVAVAVTKTPMPFMDKNGDQDWARELTAEQAADPNRPMFGKQEAARQAAKELAQTPAAMPVAVPATSAAEMMAVPAGNGESMMPLQAAEEKWIYYLQVGAFHQRKEAESTKARLALHGYEAGISELTSNNAPLYRVRLGPYVQIDAMNRVRSQLSDTGMEVAVVRLAK